MTTRSVAVLRAQARAPRALVMVCVVAFAVVGVRHAFAPGNEVRNRVISTAARSDLVARFAADRAARRLVRGSDSQVVGDDARGRQRLITVAVTAPQPAHVAVLVSRDALGRVVVHEPLAIVAGATVIRRPQPDGGREVADVGLVRVAGRVMRNYLRGEREDVAADLAAGAQAVVPELRMQPRPADAVTWVVPGRRIAVALSARIPSGALIELRYELGVVRSGGRWLVSQIHVDPLHQEVRP